MVRNMIAADIASLNIAPTAVARVENTTVAGVPVRLYYPSGKAAALVFNIHGGALVAGDLDTHDNISRKLAHNLQAVVVALDYRKAPEHPFPQSLDDVGAVYQWIVENTTKLGAPDKKINLVSDSGGCLLAAALQVDIAQKKWPNRIFKSLYINPAFDLRNPGVDFYALVTQWYLSGANPNDARVSPALAPDYKIFAPCLIVVNEKDALSSQGVAFHTQLDAAWRQEHASGNSQRGSFWRFMGGRTPGCQRSARKWCPIF